MAEPIYFAPLRVPVIDARTGLMSREWYLFFQALWLRSGGSVAPSNDDLLQNSAEGVGSADLLALIASSDATAGQLLLVVSDLREQVAELKKELDGLRQGPVM